MRGSHQDKEASMTQPDRLRPSPQVRFAPPVQLFDLTDAAARLREEPQAPRDGHRQVALDRHGPMTLVLFTFERDSIFKDHQVPGMASLYVVHGHLRVSTDEGDHDLRPGQVLTIGPGVVHSVHAPEPSEMLLTVCLTEYAGSSREDREEAAR
jgi:quercetin dioxygenase-like cupin family protein